IAPGAGYGDALLLGGQVAGSSDSSSTLAWYGYLWLLCGSAFFFLRCLLDLVLVGRPALAPNLNPSGLIWLSLALFVCLVVVAFYLLLPYTAYHFDQVHHVLPTALLLWAFASYRKPFVAGLLLSLSACTGYWSLFLLFPWLGFYWKRGQGRFLFGFFLAVLIC